MTWPIYSVFFHITLKFASGQAVLSASLNWLIIASTWSISTLRHLGFRIQEMFFQYNYIPSLFPYVAHRFIRYTCKTGIQPIKTHFNRTDVLPYMALFSTNHNIIWKINESVQYHRSLRYILSWTALSWVLVKNRRNVYVRKWNLDSTFVHKYAGKLMADGNS